LPLLLYETKGVARRLIDKSATAEDKKEARRSAIQKRRADGMNSQFASGKTMIVSVLFSASMKTEVRPCSLFLTV